MHLTDL